MFRRSTKSERLNTEIGAPAHEDPVITDATTQLTFVRPNAVDARQYAYQQGLADASASHSPDVVIATRPQMFANATKAWVLEQTHLSAIGQVEEVELNTSTTNALVSRKEPLSTEHDALTDEAENLRTEGDALKTRLEDAEDPYHDPEIGHGIGFHIKWAALVILFSLADAALTYEAIKLTGLSESGLLATTAGFVLAVLAVGIVMGRSWRDWRWGLRADRLVILLAGLAVLIAGLIMVYNINEIRAEAFLESQTFRKNGNTPSRIAAAQLLAGLIKWAYLGMQVVLLVGIAYAEKVRWNPVRNRYAVVQVFIKQLEGRLTELAKAIASLEGRIQNLKADLPRIPERWDALREAVNFLGLQMVTMYDRGLAHGLQNDEATTALELYAHDASAEVPEIGPARNFYSQLPSRLERETA